MLASTAPPKDTDQDGIPDDWEDAHGLRKTYRLDGKKIDPLTGYTFLEEYLNSLVDSIMQEGNQDALFTTALDRANADQANQIQVTTDESGIHIYCEYGIKSIQLFDLMGRQTACITSGDHLYTIEKQTRTKGLYLLRITDKNARIQIKKVII